MEPGSERLPFFYKKLFVGFRRDCFDICCEFFEKDFLLVSQPMVTVDSFSSISAAHTAVARLRRAQRAQGCSGNVARAPAFSLESLTHQPKRRKQEKGLGTACMSAALPKRDSCSLQKSIAKGMTIAIRQGPNHPF